MLPQGFYLLGEGVTAPCLLVGGDAGVEDGPLRACLIAPVVALIELVPGCRHQLSSSSLFTSSDNLSSFLCNSSACLSLPIRRRCSTCEGHAAKAASGVSCSPRWTSTRVRGVLAPSRLWLSTNWKYGPVPRLCTRLT